jgi:hypothetical protein
MQLRPPKSGVLRYLTVTFFMIKNVTCLFSKKQRQANVNLFPLLRMIFDSYDGDCYIWRVPIIHTQYLVALHEGETA